MAQGPSKPLEIVVMGTKVREAMAKTHPRFIEATVAVALRKQGQ